MAKAQNAFDTYSATTNREELSSIIYSLLPDETPVMSAAGKKNVSNTTFDWSIDALQSASGTGELEGDEITADATPAISRASNVVQINRVTARSTGSQEASDMAGATSLLAHSMSMRARELKRNMETAICGAQGSNAGNATTARATRGIESWLATNVSRGTSGANAASATAAPTDGTQRAFSEGLLDTVLASLFDEGGDPQLLVVGSFNKGKVSDFTGRSNTRQMIDENTVSSSVDIISHDFGQLSVVPSRFSRSRSALVLDPSMISIAYLRDFETFDLAKTSDSSAKAMLVEYGVCMHNEAGHGIVADLTTS